MTQKPDPKPDSKRSEDKSTDQNIQKSICTPDNSEEKNYQLNTKKYYKIKLIRYLSLMVLSVYFFFITFGKSTSVLLKITGEKVFNQAAEKLQDQNGDGDGEKNTNILINYQTQCQNGEKNTNILVNYQCFLICYYWYAISMSLLLTIPILGCLWENQIRVNHLESQRKRKIDLESTTDKDKFSELYYLSLSHKMAELKYRINDLTEVDKIMLGKRWNLFKAYCCEKDIEFMDELEKKEFSIQTMKLIKKIDYWLQIHTADLYLPNTNIIIWIPALFAVIASIIPIYQFIDSYQTSIKQEKKRLEIEEKQRLENALQVLIDFNHPDNQESRTSNLKVRLALYELIQAKGSTPKKLVLKGVNLNSANLSNMNQGDFNLKKIDLERASLEGAIIINSDLTGARLVSLNPELVSDGDDCDYTKNIGTNFEKSTLNGANLNFARLRNARFIDAKLKKNAKLVKANLRCTNFENADLEDANLTEANLRKANLSGTDLTGAILSRANLTGAKFNEKTTWSNTDVLCADFRGSTIKSKESFGTPERPVKNDNYAFYSYLKEEVEGTENNFKFMVNNNDKASTFCSPKP